MGLTFRRRLIGHFPPTEYLELVQSIVISLDQPDYLNCTCLIEGGILFLASKVFEVTLPLHPICQRRLDISPILVDDLSGELAHADLI